MNRIILGSCADLSAIEDNSVALTVTSPPYWNAIDYESHANDSEEDYRTRKQNIGYETYDEYLQWLINIFKGVYTKTKPGGFACIIIGTILFNKKHHPAPFDLVSRLTKESLWEFHQDIIWNKVTGGVKRAGVFIQKPYPGYFYPNIMTEYILVFRKAGEPIFKQSTSTMKHDSVVSINSLFTKDIANSVWHIAPVPPRHLNHPCPFPEEIPDRLIKLYSYKGDLILDPFCGIGTTPKVAAHLGRRYVGYDTIAEYVLEASGRIGQDSMIRPQQLVTSFTKVPCE